MNESYDVSKGQLYPIFEESQNVGKRVELQESYGNHRLGTQKDGTLLVNIGLIQFILNTSVFAKMPDGRVCPDQFRGYLWKWTNYIKGYQKRWFVLSNGLLSYYRYAPESGTVFTFSLLIYFLFHRSDQ